MTRDSFLALNEAMALRQLVELLQAVELSWNDPRERDRALKVLLESLTWASAHRAASVQALAPLVHRIPANPDYHQFMSLLVPIERAHGRGVADGDFAVRTEDRARVLAPQLPLVLVVDNLRSAFNVGSIFRIAECFGIQKLYLCGYTATPEQDKLKKSAMGTEQLVDWVWEPRAEDLLQRLKADDYRIYGLETSETAVTLTAHQFPRAATALVFGNERFGLEASLLQHCDAVLEIPCQGRKNSLNVGVSLGIAAYEWRRQFTSGTVLSSDL